MNPDNEIKRLADADLEWIEDLLLHIRYVQDRAAILAKKLIKMGRSCEGKRLLADSLKHDNSKFFGIEADCLHQPDTIVIDPVTLKLAVEHHNRTNDHHPEFWAGIHNMPDVAVAHMICDWAARSAQFGTDVRMWIDEQATVKFGFTKEDEVYEKMMYFLGLLLDKPFRPVPTAAQPQSP